MAKLIRIVVYKPGEDPVVTEIPATLEAYQEIVGGDIELVRGLGGGMAIYANTEGKMRELPLNRAITADRRLAKIVDGEVSIEERAGYHLVDYLVGTFLVFRAIGTPIDEEHSLTDGDLRKLGIETTYSLVVR